MQSNGWVFHGREGCGTGHWYGNCGGTGTWYCSGSAMGSITTKFKGSGLATLDFGNCYKKGIVVVFLNGGRKSTANANVKSKRIIFEFSTGDELKIIEKGSGIIKLNSLNVECIAGSIGCSSNSKLYKG